MGIEKYTPNRVRFFVCKKYTTFSAERIVALRSINKIFSESYDFAAYKMPQIDLYKYNPIKIWLDICEFVCLFFFNDIDSN
jgi:hypothetical protein